MSRALVLYGSSEGQTASIAERVGDLLDDDGHEVTIVHAKHPPAGFSLAAYDGVVVGASVHKGKHQRYVREFVRAHSDELNRLPSAFFSVSLTAMSPAADDERETRGYIEEFLEETGWEPDLTHTVAGALKYREYGLMNRFVMKRIAGKKGIDTDTSRNHEYTDWEDVEAFTREFSRLIS